MGTLEKSFICERYVEAMKEIVTPPIELTLCDWMEQVKSFCH